MSEKEKNNNHQQNQAIAQQSSELIESPTSNSSTSEIDAEYMDEAESEQTSETLEDTEFASDEAPSKDSFNPRSDGEKDEQENLDDQEQDDDDASSYLDEDSLKLAEHLPLELRRIITYYLPRYSHRLSDNLRSILSDKWFITLIDLDVKGHLKIGFAWNQEELQITLSEVSSSDDSSSEYPHLLTGSDTLIRVLKNQLNPQIALLNGQISYHGNNQILYILNVFNAINCRHIIRTIEIEKEQQQQESEPSKKEASCDEHQETVQEDNFEKREQAQEDNRENGEKIIPDIPEAADYADSSDATAQQHDAD